jgi:hypothetical protein
MSLLDGGFQPLETTVFRAPLAIRFLDPARAVPVTDGLTVTAWAAGDPATRRTARRSPISATYGFADLPGMRTYESGQAGPPAVSLPSLPGPERPFVVRVIDTSARFLPLAQVVMVPQPALVLTRLFSAPTRPAPAGFAAITGEVWATTSGTATTPSQPAGWAIVQLIIDGVRVAALADSRGRFACYAPYPDAIPPLTGSLPGGGGPIDQLSWPVNATVQYQPGAQRRAPGTDPLDPPELSSVLGQAVAIIDDGGSTAASIWRTLRFGLPLVLASNGASVLLVGPA